MTAEISMMVEMCISFYFPGTVTSIPAISTIVRDWSVLVLKACTL